MKRFCVRMLACCLLMTMAATGCQPAAQTTAESKDGHGHGHSHGGRPESLQAAVEQLRSIRDTIAAAMQAGQPGDAHGPLHEVGTLLTALPEVASEAELEPDALAAVKSATDDLFDAFGAVDAAFHGGGGDKQAAFEKVADAIDEGIAEIAKYATEGDAHDGEDNHEEHEEYEDEPNAE